MPRLQRYQDIDLEGITFRVPASWPITFDGSSHATAYVPERHLTIRALTRLHIARRLAGLSREGGS